MKKAYLFLALFGIWCFASSIWFLLSLKNAGDTSQLIQSPEAGMTIAQILVIILISVLLGFAIAWYLREDHLNQKRGDVQHLLLERESLLSELHQAKQRAQKAEYTLARARATFHDDYIQISRERDRTRQKLAEEQKEKELLRAELDSALQRLQEEQQREQQLRSKIEQQQQEASKKENAGVRYFINPFQIAATLESADIDDLKKIKGIGPVIERKLNMLGIVSFKQISELSNEAIEQIAHTLKFFPDRIERDRWLEQARECMKNKTRK